MNVAGEGLRECVGWFFFPGELRNVPGISGAALANQRAERWKHKEEKQESVIERVLVPFWPPAVPSGKRRPRK